MSELIFAREFGQNYRSKNSVLSVVSWCATKLCRSSLLLRSYYRAEIVGDLVLRLLSIVFSFLLKCEEKRPDHDFDNQLIELDGLTIFTWTSAESLGLLGGVSYWSIQLGAPQ